MSRHSQWKTGAAFALATAFGYSALTAVFAMWPGAGDAFYQSVTLHTGTDASGASTHWSMAAFGYSVALLMVASLAAGMLFAWVRTMLTPARAR